MAYQVDIKGQLLRLNLDDNFLYLGKEDYVDALNITTYAEAASESVGISNVVGNQLVPFTKPAGVNETIGFAKDELNNLGYEFLWNSNSYHTIIIYNNANRTRTKLLQNLTDTGGVDILQFTQTNKINHADIIYRGNNEGNLLFWTDGNVLPKKINVQRIANGTYGVVKLPFITTQKAPPIDPIIASYGNDSTRTANSLRKQLVMATYQFKYDDYELSTFNIYSKIALPVGYYGADNDTDSTNNNYIKFTVDTGDENVTDINIAVRFNVGSDWQNWVQAVSLNKAQLGIPNNTTYDYLFYNDGIYPVLDQTFFSNLSYWVPKIAQAQCAANGNTIEYAGITENFNNYPTSQLQIIMTAANVTNSPPSAGPPNLTYVISGTQWIFTVTGNVPTGTIYKIVAYLPGNGTQQFAYYGSLGGDTINNVATGLYNYIATNWPGYAASLGSGTFTIVPPLPGFSVTLIQVTPGSGAGISTQKTWLWNANYIFGLAYKDDQGMIMPGVTTFVNPVSSNNDFSVTTPPFSLSSGNVQTPVISASINHTPPAGAVTYSWVRQRTNYDNVLMYETCDFQDHGDGYLYFCLANILYFQSVNTNFIYSSPNIVSGSRIQIIAGITAGVYDGKIWNQDYEILGTVTRMLTGGSSPANDVLYVKVLKPTTYTITPAYEVNMMVMVYTPLLNPTALVDSVFFEWGEEYGIYSIGGINYHRGMTQDQTATQPAEFSFAEGDFYFHTRAMYNSLIFESLNTVPIMDPNWSDFFLSAVNDNGRGLVIAQDANVTYYPATIRFSLAYQDNTSINQTNQFLFDNFQDLDRSFGSILKMQVYGKYIRIGQQRKIGAIPVFNQISVDSNGSALIAATDSLLNPVQYYEGDWGVGNAPECWSYYNYASYFFDSFRGIWCRLSRDGIVPISINYKINSWATVHGVLRGSTYKIYGTFDPKSNFCIFSFSATNNDPAYTIAFDEKNNAFKGFYSYAPEWMGTIGNLLITWLNGDLYTHDSSTYNNFYGVQYPSYIENVFMDKSGIKKKYMGLGYKSLNNVIWAAPNTGDIYTSTVNPDTGLQQESSMISEYFELQETTLGAGLWADANSLPDPREGLINGNPLGGNYIAVKLTASTANTNELLNLTEPYITWIPSGRNF